MNSIRIQARRLFGATSTLKAATSLSWVVIFVCATQALASEGNQDVIEIPIPRVNDERLKIELFASEPDLVTPTGITVDGDGNVYVIESHTHFRPEGYQGPIADRIRVFRDTDGDGSADRVTTFFQGTSATMNIAVHPDGGVYVATRSDIFRLRDRNGDGIADENTTLIRLKTPGNYPHNGLSGFAFDLAGNMFFGFGENLGEDYEIIGRDGVRLSGGGEGGNIYRSTIDGAELELWATGFWNPFHLCFDNYGQLFAVDNDPDWRPPCRLLHIVRGGDYGYRFALGRRGTHPFSSWFGDVPGTLGMVCGTGEAPSGVLSYQSDHLPAEYVGSLLATSWGVHAIERFQLDRKGASFVSQAETIVKGGEDFRPVGIAMGPDGSLYVSDWVKRSYELHGHGRVWRISAKQPGARKVSATTQERFASAHRPTSRKAAMELASDEAGVIWLGRQLNPQVQEEPRLRSLAIEALAAKDLVTDEQMYALLTSDPILEVRIQAAQLGPLSEQVIEVCEELLSSTEDSFAGAEAIVAAILRRGKENYGIDLAWRVSSSDDPYVRQAAFMALSSSLSSADLAAMTVPTDELQRLQWALLLMHKSDEPAREVIPQLLNDESATVRFVALRWIGEQRIDSYNEGLFDRMMEDPSIEELFDAYLATLDLLEGQRTGAEFEKQEIKLLDQMIQNTPYRENPKLVDIALRRLVHAVQRDREGATPQSLETEFLIELASGNQRFAGSLEAIYALRDIARPNGSDVLAALLTGEGLLSEPQVSVALSGLDPASDNAKAALNIFLAKPESALRRSLAIEQEVLRAWINHDLGEKEKQSLVVLAETAPDLADDVTRLLNLESLSTSRPEATAVGEWENRLSSEIARDANVEAGERIFFHTRIAKCALCHQVNGRGGLVGPDLSHAAQLGQRRIVESILQPSREIAPKYSAWTIVTSDGKVRTGLLITERGSEQIYADQEGNTFGVQFNDIEERSPSPKSLMPDGLFDELTDGEIRDLVAYLLSLE